MAENLASISNALGQTFQGELERQWNRSAVAASRIPIRAGSGKNASWSVEFSGATATTVADGSDVQSSEYSNDVNVPAVLAWAHYRHSFQISETELDAAASSVGIPQALEDLFGERIMGGGAKIASAINADIYAGTGIDGSGNPTLVGLVSGGALSNSGTYAGVPRGTYTEFNGNVFANGGTPRALTMDLLEQVDASIFTNSGQDFDELLVSPGIYRKYKGLFETVKRVVTDGGASPRYDSSTDQLFFRGKPVTRDRDCPAGTIVFKNNAAVEAKFLPRVFNPIDSVIARNASLTASDGKRLMMTNIPVRIAVLGKTGDNVKVTMKSVVQILVRRPNSMALVQDISEAA